MRACDVELTHTMAKISIYLPTIRASTSNEVLIARTHLETCPVSMLECYMSWIGFDLTSELFLFRAK